MSLHAPDITDIVNSTLPRVNKSLLSDIATKLRKR